MENSKQKHLQVKSPNHKVFQLTQKYFATAGIVPNLAIQPYPLNGKISIGFLLLGSSLICNFKYTFYEARTFVEYTQSIYMCSIAALIIFALVIIILKVEKLFEFINGCEKLINTS